MLNQVSVEALYSATYVENYLDCVENLPDDLQRLLSRIRELDIVYLTCIRDVKKYADRLKSSSLDEDRKDKTFKLMQQSLITAQEQGDEKMALVQLIQDLIENKNRLLDHDYKNLDFGKDEPANENKEQQPPATNNTSTTSLTHSERPTKRARRTRHDTFSGLESNQNDNGTSSDHILRSQVVATPAGTGSSAPKKGNTGAGKKKKRKSRGNTSNSGNNTSTRESHREEATPPREEEPAIDPDEPTYCLCDQISFGEMIMCDNDLCPIEWFHFSCVSLTTKPKGKWYCPKCRGDRANVMKPKQQFLRELERYNKEKEEKT